MRHHANTSDRDRDDLSTKDTCCGTMLILQIGIGTTSLQGTKLLAPLFGGSTVYHQVTVAIYSLVIGKDMVPRIIIKGAGVIRRGPKRARIYICQHPVPKTAVNGMIWQTETYIKVQNLLTIYSKYCDMC